MKIINGDKLYDWLTEFRNNCFDPNDPEDKRMRSVADHIRGKISGDEFTVSKEELKSLIKSGSE